MVMSLKYYINVICIKYRSQLCTKDHTVCIRMVKSRTVDILMDGYDTPFCIRISLYSLFDSILMLCYIVIVGIQNNEKSLAIAVIIVSASCCFSIFCVVRVIEMICVVWIQGIMVSNGSCYRKACKCICTKIRSILFLFCSTGFVYLVTGRDYKVYVRVFCKCSI